ncbi:metallophosphoesterase [Spirulina sp. CCNP1310]|uniref:metallophosphoesterase family protein n=1 Tax=Spirulina sp. CCNP1310 TaxID=3110249 RepID=UPI002B201018|nr:metallophosphoesterase [Spirulina sp. CCNP1310]MEA5417586.1 metallophosphoesterase [Spirulina sp. CCNP1310]
MNRLCRFAIASDLHIALPHTISPKPGFHLVEVSIPAFEQVLAHLEQLDLDFLLLPGDLTQDGEWDNHRWLLNRLEKLPFPTYVVPGNHDLIHPLGDDATIGMGDFAPLYQRFGYDNPQQLYYGCELVPGVQLVALNSTQFDPEGKQLGCLDEAQWQWLAASLPEWGDRFVIVMIHHNVLEHLPHQATHPLGRRYMLKDAARLRALLRANGVQLTLTGHLHIQDVAQTEGLTEILTGSLVGYPHPYRIVELWQEREQIRLDLKTYCVKSLPGWENLPELSRDWIAERSFPFMSRLVMGPPFYLQDEAEIAEAAKALRYFWPDLAAGDCTLTFPQLPLEIQAHLETFNATAKIDNQAIFRFQSP